MLQPIVKTKINGIPVIIQFLEIGPATSERMSILQKEIENSIVEYDHSTRDQIIVKIIKIDKPDGETITQDEIDQVKLGLNKPKNKLLSKTLWFNVLTLISTVGVLILTQGIVTGPIAAYILISVLVINIILRMITKQPLDLTTFSKIFNAISKLTSKQNIVIDKEDIPEILTTTTSTTTSTITPDAEIAGIAEIAEIIHDTKPIEDANVEVFNQK